MNGDRELTGLELERLKALRKTLVDEHEDCDGLGIVLTDGSPEECVCARSLELCRRLILARAPYRYWTLTCKNEFKLAESTAILGGRVTETLVEIVKRGVLDNPIYVHASELSSWLHKQSEEWLGVVERSSVVVVDALGRAESSRLSGQLFDHLRRLYDQGSSIISGGVPPKELEAIFSKYINSDELQFDCIDMRDLGRIYGQRT